MGCSKLDKQIQQSPEVEKVDLNILKAFVTRRERPNFLLCESCIAFADIKANVQFDYVWPNNEIYVQNFEQVSLNF